MTEYVIVDVFAKQMWCGKNPTTEYRYVHDNELVNWTTWYQLGRPNFNAYMNWPLKFRSTLHYTVKTYGNLLQAVEAYFEWMKWYHQIHSNEKKKQKTIKIASQQYQICELHKDGSLVSIFDDTIFEATMALYVKYGVTYALTYMKLCLDAGKAIQFKHIVKYKGRGNSAYIKNAIENGIHVKNMIAFIEHDEGLMHMRLILNNDSIIKHMQLQ